MGQKGKGVQNTSNIRVNVIDWQDLASMFLSGPGDGVKPGQKSKKETEFLEIQKEKGWWRRDEG